MIPCTINGKADMIAALQCQIPSAVPTWEIEFHAWDSASGRHAIFGEEFEKLTTAERERTMHENAEILLSVAADMQWSALTVPGSWWHQGPGEVAYYTMQPAMRLRQCKIISDMASSSLMLIASTGGIIGANYSEDFCLAMYEDPESIDARCQSSLLQGIEAAKIFRDYGIEAVFSASDIADNHGPFFTPAQAERWIYSWMRKLSSTLRDLGIFSIFHSDGNLTSCIEGIVSGGFDAWQAIDPVAGMDIAATQKTVAGRMCLCGNVDCGLLLTATPEQVFQATRDLLRACKPAGGLVLGASNAVQPDVPIENYRAMIAAWHQEK